MNPDHVLPRATLTGMRLMRRRVAQAMVVLLLGPFLIIFATWINGEWVIGFAPLIGSLAASLF